MFQVSCTGVKLNHFCQPLSSPIDRHILRIRQQDMIRNYHMFLGCQVLLKIVQELMNEIPVLYTMPNFLSRPTMSYGNR